MSTFKVEASDKRLISLTPANQWGPGSKLDGNRKSTAVFTSTPGSILSYSFVGNATSVMGDASANTVVTINVDGHVSTVQINPMDKPGVHAHQIFAVQNLDSDSPHVVSLTFDQNPALYISQVLFNGRPAKKQDFDREKPDSDPKPVVNSVQAPQSTIATPTPQERQTEAPTTPQIAPTTAPAPVATTQPEPAVTPTAATSVLSNPSLQTGGATDDPGATSTLGDIPGETVSIILGTSVPTALSGPTTSLPGPAPLPLGANSAGMTNSRSGVIVGAIVGSVMFTFLLIAFFGWLNIRRKSKKRRVYRRDPERNAGGVGVRVSQTALVVSGEEMAQVDSFVDPATRPNFFSHQGLWTPVDTTGDRGFQSIARVQSLDSEIAAADAPRRPAPKSGFFSKLWNKSSKAEKAERHNSQTSLSSTESQAPQPGQPFAGVPLHPDDVPL